jgi:hypothetical protein
VEPMAQDLVLPEPIGDYAHALPIKISLPVLRWLVPVCLILIFLLTFFPWIGSYPGGIGFSTQTGWGTAFGGWTLEASVEKKEKRRQDADEDYKPEKPGASAFMIIYIILICLLTLASIGVIVLPFLPIRLPPLVETLKQMQGLILGGVALLAFLFLNMELIKGFNLSNLLRSKVEKQFKVDSDDVEKRTEQQIVQGGVLSGLSLEQTLWFRLVFWLNLLAIIGGALEFWVVRRGNKPPPKIEFVW